MRAMGGQVFDHIVIGAGGMGSAAIYELARRGRRVLGLEQFTIPHELGSSAGATRIFRFAYFEHPSYVPLMRLSLARWQALERDFGERLVTVTGGLDMGLPSGRVVSGSKEACRTHGLTHEVMRASEVSRRYPAWRLPAEFEAVYQPEAGFLPADRAIVAHVTLARKLGADVRENEPVRGWKAVGGGVEVETERGRYEAGSLILAAGAWSGKLLSTAQAAGSAAAAGGGLVQDAGSELPRPRAFPVFILDCPERGNFYGFPEPADEGFKIGKFRHRLENVDPDTIDRHITPEDAATLTWAERYLAKPMGQPVTLQDLHVRQLAGRAFHRRCPARAPQRRGRRRLLRARLQVLLRHRRDPGRPRHARRDAARHPVVQAFTASADRSELRRKCWTHRKTSPRLPATGLRSSSML